MSFLKNIYWRYATKKFNSKKVGDFEIEKIKEAIRFSPSSFGAQPYHIALIENNEKNKNIFKDLTVSSKNNESKLETCSHLFVFCARTDYKKRFRDLEIMQKRPKGMLSQVGMFLQISGILFNFIFFKRFTTSLAWAKMQTYIALGFAIAACAELKIDSSPMEGFDSLAYKKILKLEQKFKPIVILAVGYRDNEDTALKYQKARFSNEDLFIEY